MVSGAVEGYKLPPVPECRMGPPKKTNCEVPAMSTDDAFEAGYDAYGGGIDPDDNPFKPETPEGGKRRSQYGGTDIRTEERNELI